MELPKMITKEKVIKAIKTEPLIVNYFVERDKYSNIVTNPNCSVCAVGAVFRASGMSNTEIDDVTSDPQENICSTSIGRIEDLLKSKLYLNALSVKFEYLASKYGTGKRTRNELVKFVEENFPYRIKLHLE